MTENMRLPHFLKNIDALTKKMDKQRLEAFIHEIARIWPESERKSFETKLESFQTIAEEKDDADKDIDFQINDIITKLEIINSGQRCLDSEYNEEWDDWYNSDADEVLFSDPEKLLTDIEDAIQLIHKCIDMEINNDDVMKLVATISALEVSADGDYNDYDGEPLEIKDLYEHNLLYGDYDKLVKECLYLTYTGTELSDRAEELFYIFESMSSYDVTLENVLQMGNRDLPEFDEFLKLWIKYLADNTGTQVEKLIKEAQSMIQDDDTIFENAKKYADSHPELYLQLLELKLDAQDDEKMMNTGFEALGIISDSYLIRSKIALLTAIYAEKAGEITKAEQCWLEAFRSDSSVVNYMRLRFETQNWCEYKNEVRRIIDELFKNNTDKDYFICSQNYFQKNTMTKYKYCILMFFEHEFEQMIQTGMNTKESLGWSGTFMKEGISFLLLLLYSGSTLPVGLQAMQSRVVSACGFEKEQYCFGTNKIVEQKQYELFNELFTKWKEDVTISEDEQNNWIHKIEKWICDRTQAIMENNRRNYYGECAGFIAALGEVMESNGEEGAKNRLLEQYRYKYSRRRAFHEELRRYGMKKIVKK